MDIVSYTTENFPLQKEDYDAGYDLYSTEDYEIKPFSNEKISTGIKVSIPKTYYGKIESRSSLASKNIIVTGGVIDSGYRGELKVILVNLNNKDFLVKKGDKIAQIVFIKISSNIIKVCQLNQTERGEKGFGSTGFSFKN